MSTMKHCQFFVERKKRYCRMTVKIGNQFCGEHMKVDINEIKQRESKRIACPLDNSHTCFQSRLKQHLKVCNAKRLQDALPEYIIDGINRGDVHLVAPQHIPLIKLDNSVIDLVIKKVEIAYDKLPKVDELILNHEVLTAEIENPVNGKGSKKHLLQNSSLLAHLRYAGLVQENTCFVEFGAGRGKLTYWLSKTIEDTKGSTLMLVDRSSPRHKNDNKLKNEETDLNVIRIRADIAHLSLKNIDTIKNSKHKVGIAKHLCGAATDLTIRCLGQLIDEPSPGVIGLVVAFCCHHCCEYISYVGKEYLHDSGFTVDEFPILCSLASWATCGLLKKDVPNSDGTETKDGVRFVNRELIGRKVKMIMNWGRVEYLKSIGFTQSNLYFYTKTEISLENMCMVAIRDSS